MAGNWIVEVSPGDMGRGSKGGYVVKDGGWVTVTQDAGRATGYRSKEEAREQGKVGHHRDMGGNGFRGRVILRPLR